MSRTDVQLAADVSVHAGMWPTIRQALARLLRDAAQEWFVRRAIAELSALDDRMLRDIGLKRSEIESQIRWGRRGRRYR